MGGGGGKVLWWDGDGGVLFVFEGRREEGREGRGVMALQVHGGLGLKCLVSLAPLE